MTIDGKIRGYAIRVTKRSWDDTASEAASEVSALYSRLRALRIKTPDIDAVDGPWDWDLHVSYLQDIRPYLSNVTMKETRAFAEGLVKRKARRSAEYRGPR
jgi:hypothetical protein